MYQYFSMDGKQVAIDARVLTHAKIGLIAFIAGALACLAPLCVAKPRYPLRHRPLQAGT